MLEGFWIRPVMITQLYLMVTLGHCNCGSSRPGYRGSVPAEILPVPAGLVQAGILPVPAGSVIAVPVPAGSVQAGMVR